MGLKTFLNYLHKVNQPGRRPFLFPYQLQRNKQEEKKIRMDGQWKRGTTVKTGTKNDKFELKRKLQNGFHLSKRQIQAIVNSCDSGNADIYKLLARGIPKKEGESIISFLEKNGYIRFHK